MTVLAFGSVATLYRTVIVLGCILAGSWLSLRAVLSSSDPLLENSVHPQTPSTLSSSRLTTSTNNLADVLFPVPPTAGDSPWVRENHIMLQSLFHCIESFNCHPKQTKVVILASIQFRMDLLGDTGGEKIWAKSTTQALRNQGYTYLYSSSPEQTIQLYQMFPDFVQAILVDEEEAERCIRDTEYCSLSADNPAGIPPWKIFSFAFWAPAAHPLGHQWTLAPENYELLGLSHNTYLGYSIEQACRSQPFVPHAERENEAYILAKLLSFFTPERDRAWSPAMFDTATNATGIKYVIGAINDTLQGEWPAAELPSNCVDYGLIGQAAFLEKLSKTRVLIGMGNPSTSPTPYDALCLGVPFINPINNWNKENPSDRSQWATQHPVLALLDPPYVYNVFQGDLDGFVQAIKDAISHPIHSYVLKQMRMSEVEKRLTAILEKDWQFEASLDS